MGRSWFDPAWGQVLFNFGVNLARTAVLRGTSQWLAINLNGATVPTAGKIGYSLLWTEEPN